MRRVRTARRDSGVHTLIINPGTHPELQWLAVTAVRTCSPPGVLYLSAASFSADHRLMRLAALLPPRLGAELLRRQLPGDLQVHNCKALAPFLDLLGTILRRRGHTRGAERATACRNMMVYWRARRIIARLGPNLSLVVIQANALPRLTRACQVQNLPVVLNVPLPHYQLARRLLQEEVAANPAWEASMQSASYTACQEAAFDDELQAATAVLVASELTARSLAKIVQPERTHLVPLGTATTPMPRERQERKAEDPVRLLYVGQLTQRKGLSYLLEALSILLHGGHKFTLTLVGPDYRGTADKIKGSYPQLPVRILGPKPRSELASVYGEHDVFVFPSLLEGFGLTMLEALAAGLPVVATDRTAARALGIDPSAGRVIPAGSAHAIASAVAEIVYGQQSLASMREAAQTIAARHTWSRYGERAWAVCAAQRRL